MRVTFKCFDSKLASREKLFKAAVEFANKLEQKQLINITHSEDRDNIVLTIWYWTDEEDKSAEIKARVGAEMAKRYGDSPPPGTAKGPEENPAPQSDVTVTPIRSQSHTQELPIPPSGLGDPPPPPRPPRGPQD